MPEVSDKDLEALFKAAGHAMPTVDLTDRIMARVSVTPIARPRQVPPLIGPFGWLGISAFLLVFFVVLALFVPSAPSSFGVLGSFPRWTADLFQNTSTWLMWSTGGAACALFFVLVDRMLAQRSPGR
jgi:hypothetical protein